MLPYAKPYWVRAILAVVITIPVGSMDAVIAWSLKPFMDVVLVEKQSGWTMYIPLMIIVFSILQACFTYIATYLNTWVGNKIAFDVKRQLYDKLLHCDAAVYDVSNSGDILFRYNNDAEAACSGLLNNMKLFTTRFFSSLSLIIVLFYNSWKLAVIAVIVMLLALYPLTMTRKRLNKVVAKDANAIAALFMRYNETYSGNRIITAYNLFDYCKRKFIDAVNNLFDLGMQMITKTAVISPLMHFISSFGIAFVIWYGSHLIVTHQITVGNFASFITSLVMLYNPLKSIGNNYNGVIFSLMAVERVFEKLRLIPKVKNCENPVIMEHCNGEIEYRDVCFEYVEGKPVLKHINLEIKHGQTVALVGNSGGGKTTVSSLLPRFYDVTGGEILLDGINIKNIEINSLRDQISIVFQDNFLFGGTIRENILFGNPNVSEEQIKQAVKSACLDEFIASLENGLDTQIGERGVMLSGGQKQRIAIARAFIKNAPIFILDEATSALDNKSEAIVQNAIDNLMKDRTVMVIAHRLSTVRNADKIVVIKNGEIAEQGSHEELLHQEGVYASLYASQLV
ncbi:MAG: ABC transporter ATP-binding protein [Alphaproteobacteria bacterium]|nr:ABC transporter ATP-binding protein [Alphaproteobacteria bacterium]